MWEQLMLLKLVLETMNLTNDKPKEVQVPKTESQ